MASAANFDQEIEIEELILSIDKLTRNNLRYELNTFSEIKTKLLHLRNFIPPSNDTQDIVTTVDDFIDTLNSLSINQDNKLLLKQCNNKLGQELKKYKSKKNVYSLLGL